MPTEKNQSGINEQLVSDVTKAAAAIEQQLEEHVPEGIEDPAIRQEAEARKLLSPAQQDESRKEAEEKFREWKINSSAVGTFGKDVLQSLNDVIEEYRRISRNFEPEEIRTHIKAMAQKASRIDSSYNPRSEDTHVVTKVRRRLQDTGKRLIWSVKTIQEEYEEDKADAFQLLDKTAAVVSERLQMVSQQLATDEVFFYKYGQERIEFVLVVAVMEYALDMARNELRTLKDNPPMDVSPMEVTNQIDNLTHLIQNIEVQLLDYRNRMWLTRATQQRIKSARQAHKTIERQLRNHLDMTIPEMKDSIREIGNLMEDLKTAELTSDLSAEANATIMRAARLSSEAIPETFRAGMTGIYKADTIRTLGSYIAQMHETEAEILTTFAQDEQDNLAAMAEANKMIAHSSGKITDAALNRHMRDAAQRLAVPENKDDAEADEIVAKRLRQ